MTTPHDAVEIRALPYDHPDVQQLVEGLQQLYVELYGGRDDSPIDRSEFVLPRGTFAVAYDTAGGTKGGRAAGTAVEAPTPAPVAMGAWRLLPDGRAELKRMFVRPDQRGRGLSRLVLGWLEQSAREAGVVDMVIETNTVHAEAIRLYESVGYAPIPAYGHYADEPETVSLGRSLAERD
ncbi:GNAT family N-acetyltransferase [Frigoribacterium sp. ACAM 257]|uniref:GNAT family N-acetyltransferase n=1 Tax=Frigoribacterium sp. ACAM 257 TaxID=2508998 RepID=UPI0011B9683A|nr:GNAT family N-acetyltransferase [Frigoribacterium sp. ACAM 257]TWX38879.1 GNAT family N-acetyltransferase [Frigoribacterium sp. ACAM 257]